MIFSAALTTPHISYIYILNKVITSNYALDKSTKDKSLLWEILSAKSSFTVFSSCYIQSDINASPQRQVCKKTLFYIYT